MRAEVLYFKGCPSYREVERALREIVNEEGIKADVELVAVNTDEEADNLKFPGSPTVRIQGEDLFPTGERESWALGCRVYETPDGIKGAPAADLLRAALRKFSRRA